MPVDLNCTTTLVGWDENTVIGSLILQRALVAGGPILWN